VLRCAGARIAFDGDDPVAFTWISVRIDEQNGRKTQRQERASGRAVWA